MIDPTGALITELRTAGIASGRVRGGEPARKTSSYEGDALGPGQFKRFVVLVRLGYMRQRRAGIATFQIGVRAYGATAQDAASLYGAMAAARVIEPRVTTIEGQKVLIVERRPPLQPTLAGLRHALRVTFEVPLRRTGARKACVSDQDHRLIRFLEGRHVGLDGVVRDLRLFMCADCEAVSVRDISIDRLDRLPTGSQPLRRRDHAIGWYTGSRPGQREYR
jgi:hypothetical protein